MKITFGKGSGRPNPPAQIHPMKRGGPKITVKYVPLSPNYFQFRSSRYDSGKIGLLANGVITDYIPY